MMLLMLKLACSSMRGFDKERIESELGLFIGLMKLIVVFVSVEDT